MIHWHWAQTANNGILGTAGYVFVGGYLCVLVLLGWLGHHAKKENSLADFYLGGRGLGLMVLLLTLYATQYSGNTMLGFVGKSYRQGYQFLSAVTFMMAIVGFYLIYAPRLHRLAHQRHYVTMGDYLQDRFQYRPLTILASSLGVLALGNYILTNLKALGLLTETITGISGSYAPGVILLAANLPVYLILWMLGAWDAWLVGNGMKTLGLRMERHSANGLALSEFLNNHERVQSVNYLGLPKHRFHEVAKKQMSSFGGMMCFEVDGGYEAGIKFMNALSIGSLAPTMGDVDTLIMHPASMSHLNVAPEIRLKNGISDSMIRVSVGIENIDDLKSDFDRALRAMS